MAKQVPRFDPQSGKEGGRKGWREGGRREDRKKKQRAFKEQSHLLAANIVKDTYIRDVLL